MKKGGFALPFDGLIEERKGGPSLWRLRGDGSKGRRRKSNFYSDIEKGRKKK